VGTRQTFEHDTMYVVSLAQLPVLSAQSLRLRMSEISRTPMDSIFLRSSFLHTQGTQKATLFRDSSGDGFVIDAKAAKNGVSISVLKCVQGKGLRVLDGERLLPSEVVVMAVSSKGKRYLNALQGIPGDFQNGVDPLQESRDRFVRVVQDLHPSQIMNLLPQSVILAAPCAHDSS
jgi:hypothetical protein